MRWPRRPIWRRRPSRREGVHLDAGQDLAQCVPTIACAVDRRSGQIRNAARVREIRVDPAYIAAISRLSATPPMLSRHRGIGAKTAARLHQHGHIEQFPTSVIGENRERALLFKHLATLRTDAPLFDTVDQMRWAGATPAFRSVAEKVGNAGLAERVGRLKFR